jgi:hypothetical protein
MPPAAVVSERQNHKHTPRSSLPSCTSPRTREAIELNVCITIIQTTKQTHKPVGPSVSPPSKHSSHGTPHHCIQTAVQDAARPQASPSAGCSQLQNVSQSQPPQVQPPRYGVAPSVKISHSTTPNDHTSLIVDSPCICMASIDVHRHMAASDPWPSAHISPLQSTNSNRPSHVRIESPWPTSESLHTLPRLPTSTLHLHKLSTMHIQIDKRRQPPVHHLLALQMRHALCNLRSERQLVLQRHALPRCRKWTALHHCQSTSTAT